MPLREGPMMFDAVWVLAVNALLMGVGFACGWFARKRHIDGDGCEGDPYTSPS